MKLEELSSIKRVFDEMPERGVAIWNAMVTGCAEKGYDFIALDFFRKMQLVGHDHYSVACVLSLCDIELLGFGRQVHSLVFKTGFMARPSVVNALLTMYSRLEEEVSAIKALGPLFKLTEVYLSYDF